MKGLSLVATCSIAILCAQSAPDPSAVFEHTRAQVLDTVRHLPRYTCVQTCVQTIDRHIFKLDGVRPPRFSCDDLVARKRRGELITTLVATDRLRLDVAVGEGGREIFSWVGASQFASGRLDDLVPSGPLGTGAFGPFLIDTFGQSGVAFHFREGSEYWYRVPKELSHYRLLNGGRAQVFAYDGTVQIDPGTAQLQQFTARTGELPWESGVCEATTTVAFQRMQIGAGAYLLPRESRLRFLERTGDEMENVTSYATCHEFRGESEIHFDQPEGPALASLGHPSSAPRAISPGIEIELALETPIDTATAAAGDPVSAKLTRSFVDRKTGRRVPAGAMIHGRLTRVEHHIEWPHYFVIAIAWNSLHSGSETFRFAARFSKEMEKDNRLPFAEHKTDYFPVRPQAHPIPAGTFVLQTRDANHVMPRGYPMVWVTVASDSKT